MLRVLHLVDAGLPAYEAQSGVMSEVDGNWSRDRMSSRLRVGVGVKSTEGGRINRGKGGGRGGGACCRRVFAMAACDRMTN